MDEPGKVGMSVVNSQRLKETCQAGFKKNKKSC